MFLMHLIWNVTLYLAAQLLELEKPMVIALNMSDVAEDMGIKYDLKKWQK